MTGLPIKTAAGISLVALGSLAGYAVGSGPAGGEPSTAAAKRQPVEVRTETIRRTVRVVKHERPKHRPDPATTVAPAAPAPAQQVTPATPVAPQSAPPANSTPVRTRTSGAGSPSGEREDGDDHDRGEREGRDD